MNKDCLRRYAAWMYRELQGCYKVITQPDENVALDLARYPHWDGVTVLSARSYGADFSDDDLEAIAAAFMAPDHVRPTVERVDLLAGKWPYYCAAEWRWGA